MASSSRGGAQRTGVDGLEAGGGDAADEFCLGVGVVTGDQHGGDLVAQLPGRQRRGEVGVERLENVGVRQRGRELSRRRAVGCYGGSRRSRSSPGC